MHNAAFARDKPGHYYVPIESDPQQLSSQLSAFRALGGMGANLTRPLKEWVLPLLVQQSERVTRSQAANTIVWNGTGWVGDNTDVLALSQALAGGEGKTSLILGSGGVARASWVALAERGYHVTIMARHPERVWPGPTVIPWDWGALGGKFDVIVNATPLGQYGEESVDLLELPPLSQPITVVDWVYSPRLTPLLRWGQTNADAQLIDGLTLLISQARWAWMVWFGHMAPDRVLEEAVQWSPL